MSLHILCILYMQDRVKQLESWKFIPLMYQLAARISLAGDPFQLVLHDVCYLGISFQAEVSAAEIGYDG